MKKVLINFTLTLFILQGVKAQQTTTKSKAIYKVSKELLAGEGLDYIKQKDPKKEVYQKKIYDGESFAIFMVAIKTGITNTFESFPLEEFIFWINGKAIISPEKEASFEVQSGDYFIQAKGFKGDWSFVDNGGFHLELSLIAKNRPKSLQKSPISKALIINKDIISGVQQENEHNPEFIYKGLELNVKQITTKEKQITNSTCERLLHVLSGVVTFIDETNNEKQVFYPGDFFVMPKGFKGSWSSNSLQDLRMLEVSKAINQ